jgi:hypothetical protein
VKSSRDFVLRYLAGSRLVRSRTIKLHSQRIMKQGA